MKVPGSDSACCLCLALAGWLRSAQNTLYCNFLAPHAAHCPLQVPQFLYEAGFGCKLFPERAGAVGVTQPRRVAAISTAERVADELDSRLGQVVGYQASGWWAKAQRAAVLWAFLWLCQAVREAPNPACLPAQLPACLLACLPLACLPLACLTAPVPCLSCSPRLQVRYDKRVGDNTAIKFMTDGILLR